MKPSQPPSNMTTPLTIRIVRWSICLIVLSALVAGLYVSGSPANRRRLSFDERRTSSLNQITTAIDTYAQTKRTTPPSLETLAQDQPYLATELRDPTTNSFYGYTPQAGSTSTYELCATFELASPEDPSRPPFAPTQDLWGNPAIFTHGAGTTCYTLHVRELAPVQTVPAVPKPLPATP